jgi:hypothetical protein
VSTQKRKAKCSVFSKKGKPSVQSFHQKMLKSLSKYDSFSGASDHVVDRGVFGAIMTVCSAILMLWLTITQFSSYRSIVPRERMTLDPGFGSSKLSVTLDMTMYRLKCDDLNIDIDSQTGKHQIHVSDAMKKVPFVDDDERAQSPSKYSTMSAMRTNAPGCSVSGQFEVSKVAGNFHIALGKNLNAAKGHSTESTDQPRYQFGIGDLTHYNTSHVINHLSFGKEYDVQVQPTSGSFYATHHTHSSARNTLDGKRQILAEDVSTAQYEYFIKIVPTMFTRVDGKSTSSNSFSATQHVTEVRMNALGFMMGGKFPHPGVFFKYDFSPIMVSYGEERNSFWQFLTSLCAIVGGLFTCMGLCTRCLYAGGDMIGKLD